jgi:ankyrin repeat protein
VNDPSFEDHEGNNELHLAIIRDEKSIFEEMVKREDFVRCYLNLRNVDGKSPLFLAIEHSRLEMFNSLFS